MIGGNELKESPMLKAGGTYSGPNGSKIKNKGFTTLKGKTTAGYQLTFRTQVGEGMKQMLISLENTVNAGNMSVFGASRKVLRELADAEVMQENMIMSKKTKRVTKISEKNGAYTYPTTITRTKKKIDPNAMDVGFVDHNKSEVLSEDDEKCHECGAP